MASLVNEMRQAVHVASDCGAFHERTDGFWQRRLHEDDRKVLAWSKVGLASIYCIGSRKLHS